MSKNSYSKQCKGKVKHRSSGAARAMLKSLVKSFNRDVSEMSVYCCGWCSYWHVGHNNSKKQQKGVDLNNQQCYYKDGQA